MTSEIKTARLAAGLSRPELFKLTGIPVRTLEGWEYGDRTPPEWMERLVINEVKRLNKIKMEEKEMIKYAVSLSDGVETEGLAEREEFDTIKEAVEYIGENFEIGVEYDALFEEGMFIDMDEYHLGESVFVENAKLYLENELANMDCGESKWFYDLVYVEKIEG
ncbi:MAG: helix-turn-helix transcriptional regulator [Anaerovoracaceae bacterium]